MSDPLPQNTTRSHWPVVLGTSLVVHAIVLGIPLAQHTGGDADFAPAPLRVTLSGAPDRASIPQTSAAARDVVRRHRELPPPATTPTQVLAAAVEPMPASTPLAQDGGSTTRSPVTDADTPPIASTTITAIATVSDAPPAVPDTGIVLARIRDTIAREPYPNLARQRGWEGKVQLGFRVEGSGAIDHVRVMHSSGNRLLDESAMRALQRIRYIPTGLWLDGYSAELQLPVIYRLSES